MWVYIAIPAIIGYFSLPFYFANTGQYTNWQFTLEPLQLSLLFIGLIVVGIWDELFFVGTVLGVFRAYLPFYLANILQAVIFASFLYSLGFGSWGIIVSYTFALIQGYIYKLTKSLNYAITVHIIFDGILFLALIHAHYPYIFDIFPYS